MSCCFSGSSSSSSNKAARKKVIKPKQEKVKVKISEEKKTK
jgi:hypothetical protein